MITKDVIILHHSAISGDAPQFDDVRAYHNSGAGGKWPKGHGIQYAYFIEKNGRIINGRPEEATTWNAGTERWNKRSIAICLAGNFVEEKPTSYQLDALTLLIPAIQARWDFDTILNHKDIRQTICPAVDLRAIYYAHERFLRGSSHWTASYRIKALRRGIKRARLRGLLAAEKLLRNQIDRILARLHH